MSEPIMSPVRYNRQLISTFSLSKVMPKQGRLIGHADTATNKVIEVASLRDKNWKNEKYVLDKQRD